MYVGKAMFGGLLIVVLVCVCVSEHVLQRPNIKGGKVSVTQLYLIQVVIIH